MGHTEVVQLLLAAGASLDPRDGDGTALDNAIKQKRGAVEDVLEAAHTARRVEAAVCFLTFDPRAAP